MIWSSWVQNRKLGGGKVEGGRDGGGKLSQRPRQQGSEEEESSVSQGVTRCHEVAGDAFMKGDGEETDSEAKRGPGALVLVPAMLSLPANPQARMTATSAPTPRRLGVPEHSPLLAAFRPSTPGQRGWRGRVGQCRVSSLPQPSAVPRCAPAALRRRSGSRPR